MTHYREGDTFNFEDMPEGPDCDATMPGGLPFCMLAENHSGQHVAADASMRVIAVWS